MPLPLVAAPTRDGMFVLTLDDDTVYYLPGSFVPDSFTVGTPGDEVGRAVGSSSWIRYGTGGRRPAALRFRGRLFGSDAGSQLTELQTKVKAAASVAYRGLPGGSWVYISTGLWVELAAGKTITVTRGDVNARERALQDFDVTIVLLPDQPGRFI